MSLLTVELKNESDLELFLSFAKRLDAAIIDISKTKSNSQQSPVSWLERIAKKGGVKTISNPSEWQRDTRKDKILPNRD
jgi:hypothetical protein